MIIDSYVWYIDSSSEIWTCIYALRILYNVTFRYSNNSVFFNSNMVNSYIYSYNNKRNIEYIIYI